jgi:hypothetical protein
MLNPDYAEMLSAFLDHEVRFLVVGAYAMAGHGYPRATVDLDLWVEPTATNAARVYDALVEFGAPSDHFDKDTFTTQDIVLQIGVAPQRIDILTRITGVEFAAAWERHEVGVLGALKVPILSIKDLITNKRATGRDKDIRDARLLDED